MPNNGFDAPSTVRAVDQEGNLIRPYVQWIAMINRIGQAALDAGPTTSRPTSMLWIGRQFYDETLGKPVFVHSVNPVVWHDASGAIV